MNDIWVENLWQRCEKSVKLLGDEKDTRLAIDWDDTLAHTSSLYNDHDLEIACRASTGISVSAEFERTIIIAPGMIETIQQARNYGAKVGVFTKNSQTMMAHIFNGEMACFGCDLKLSYSKPVVLRTWTKEKKEVVITGNKQIQQYIYDELIARLDFAIGSEAFVDKAPFKYIDSNGKRYYIKDLKLIGEYGDRSIVYDDGFDGEHNELALAESYQSWAKGMYLPSCDLSEEIRVKLGTDDIPLQKFLDQQEVILGQIKHFTKTDC